ncbi:MAG: acyltransferase [Rhodobacterales bacterium]|nr:acyltransferase [Rhodobacterales bacterium]
MRSSKINHPGPPANIITYWIGRIWMTVFGWDVEGEPPQESHAVIIAAPHTSNWDLPHMIAAAWVFRMRISWLGKDSLFKWPFGGFMTAIGGLPVNRKAPHGLVREVANKLQAPQPLFLAIPPSGTRTFKPTWKSGFYWISNTAGVPVVVGFLDYKRKRANLGYTFRTSGDVIADMDKVRAIYASVEAKFPELKNTILLKEELRIAQKAEEEDVK